MQLVYDLSKVRGRLGRTFPFSLSTEGFSHGGYELVGSLVFKGELKALAFEIALKARVEATLKARCGRCLTPLVYEVESQIDEILIFQGEVNRFEDEDMAFGELGEKYWVYDKMLYDFSPLVIDSLLEKLPLAPVCETGCEIVEIVEDKIEDLRWAKLAQLKQDGEV